MLLFMEQTGCWLIGTLSPASGSFVPIVLFATPITCTGVTYAVSRWLSRLPPSLRLQRMKRWGAEHRGGLIDKGYDATASSQYTYDALASSQYTVAQGFYRVFDLYIREEMNVLTSDAGPPRSHLRTPKPHAYLP